MGKEAENAQWCAIALSANVPAGNVHPIELGALSLALWRDEDGSAHLWEDRCPHRGMRLSFGFVRGARLTCLYHGWEYDADGACKSIPAHPDMNPPSTICTNPYPVAEAFGMVFTGASDASLVDGSNGPWHSVRSVFLNCSPETAADAALIPGALSDEPFVETGPVFTAEAGEAQIALAVQPRPDGQSALHLSSSVEDPSVRITLARRLTALRDTLNSGGML
ncbi:MAG: Rieske (2Fe-2S) protein [Pseudomonadota bacterium]